MNEVINKVMMDKLQANEESIYIIERHNIMLEGEIKENDLELIQLQKENEEIEAAMLAAGMATASLIDG